MSVALLVARILLSVIFVVSGAAKICNIEGSREALVGFGVPRPLSRWFGIALPLTELVVGISLLPTVSMRWGALAAFLLFVLFIAGISVNLVFGRRPQCHCFGQLASAPIGWRTLLVSLTGAAVSGGLVWQSRLDSRLSVLEWAHDMDRTQIFVLILTALTACFAVIVTYLLFNILRQQGRLLLRLEDIQTRVAGAGSVVPFQPRSALPQVGLPVGSQAPTFRLSSLAEQAVTLGSLQSSQKPVVLVFSNPSCGPCQAMMPDVAAWQHDFANQMRVVVITEGTLRENGNKAEFFGLREVLLQKQREIAEPYRASATPSAVVVRPDGTIGSFVAQGADAIRALVTQTLKAPLPRVEVPYRSSSVITPLKRGELAPALTFTTLAGEHVSLMDFRGRETLLLFWDLACGYCRQMLDELKAWERDSPHRSPALLIVSAGALEPNRALGLRSLVVISENSQAPAIFGANGTPTAVLLDADGRIASEVASGARAVMALADPAAASSAKAMAGSI